jgi:hypothetical protein
LTICFPESDGAANHTSGNKNNQQFPPLTSKIPIQAVMEVVLDSPDGSRSDVNVRAFVTFLQDRNEVWSGIPHMNRRTSANFCGFPAFWQGRRWHEPLPQRGQSETVGEQLIWPFSLAFGRTPPFRCS